MDQALYFNLKFSNSHLEIFRSEQSFNYTTVKSCKSPNITVIVKTARSYFDRREEMRKHLADINFKGDVYFIVGESQETEEFEITVKV